MWVWLQVQGNKQLEKLIEAIYDEKNKVKLLCFITMMAMSLYDSFFQIKALVQCGKLKNAYLVAINAKLPDEVRKIADVASKAGQLGVRDICEKWLQHNRKKQINCVFSFCFCLFKFFSLFFNIISHPSPFHFFSANITHSIQLQCIFHRYILLYLRSEFF